MSRKSTAEKNGLFLHTLAEQIYSSKDYFSKGSNIMTIANKIDKDIKLGKYKLLHPTSIEVNHYISDYSPYTKYILRDEDVVSFTIGTNGSKNGDPIPVRCAYTLSIKRECDYYYLIRAISEACSVGMKACGPDVKFTEPSYAIEEVLESYTDPVDGTELTDIKSLYNICGYNLENPKQMIPNLGRIPSHMENFCKGRMKEDQIFYIDVYGTNLTKHDVARNFPIPTMFKAPLFKNPKQINVTLNKIKVRHTKDLYYFIKKNFGSSIFSVRDLEKRCKNSWGKRYKFRPIQLNELSKNGIIHGVAAKFVDPDFDKKVKNEMKGNKNSKDENRTIAVHFGHSIYITDSGNICLC